MTNGKLTVNLNPPTRFSPSAWIGSDMVTAYARSRFIHCMDCDIAPLQEDFALQGTGQVLKGVLPWAIDPDFAEKLWQLSERMTGARFGN